ncbi:Hypothetical predicted protein [Cloeon dipterum]|uniref:Uncharacterized protein n=1 Tax=Cloeon dipterum TaxID=197152 RepID=A0A8S1DDL6_9INSE|nr:Hypothetical predicted protein [Cloeon dipterum]
MCNNPTFVKELKKCWRNALPAGWHYALILAHDLTKAAEAADTLYEAYGAAVPSQASSISNSAKTENVSVADVQKPQSLEAHVAVLEDGIAKIPTLLEKDDGGHQPDRSRNRSLNVRFVQTDLCFYHDSMLRDFRELFKPQDLNKPVKNKAMPITEGPPHHKKFCRIAPDKIAYQLFEEMEQ